MYVQFRQRLFEFRHSRFCNTCLPDIKPFKMAHGFQDFYIIVR